MDVIMKPTEAKTPKKAHHSEPLDLSAEETTYTKGSSTKNTSIKQYLCVRDQVPKSALSHIILNENMSQDRHLERTLSDLSSRKLKASNANDLSQRTFLAVQDRKQRKWRREDEVRLGNMNFPNLNLNDTQPSPGVEVVYHMSQFNAPSPRDTNRSAEPMKRAHHKMPFSVRKEQTELVIVNDKSYITKLPEIQVVDNEALKYYDAYRGKTMLVTGAPTTDMRFKKLENLLRPALLRESDQYHGDNFQSVSRLSRYSYNRLQNEPPPSASRKRPSPPLRERPISRSFQRIPDYHREDTQKSWMITGPDHVVAMESSKPPSRDFLNFPNKPETGSKKKKSVRILEEFKSGDVKSLAKTLKKDIDSKVHKKPLTVKVIDGENIEVVHFD